MVNKQHGEFVYAGDARVTGSSIALSRDELHHLTRVRRVRHGAEVMATDGQGMVFRARLEADDSLTILETLRDFGESTLNITLICGCLQGEAARDVVDTSVQLGACRIVWMPMKRSQEAYSENKLDKLRRAAIQATKQTGRAVLLEQLQVESWDEALAKVEPSVLWVAHPEIDENPSMNVESARAQTFIVGPEGGFDPEELELLRTGGARVIRLGRNRLRSELAVAAGLAYLRTLTRDF